MPTGCVRRRAIIEQELFEGAPRPEKGELKPDPAAPGLGLVFKRGEAAQYRFIHSVSKGVSPMRL